jgi:FKBP-type peptidyl-prolyl cis-trans isomerase FklB
MKTFLNSTVRPWSAAVLLAAMVGPAFAVDTAAKTSPVVAQPLATLQDKMNYATGVMTARSMSKNDVPVDVELIVQGLRDALAGAPTRMNEKEIKLVLQSMSADIARKMSNERVAKANLNRERGVVFQNEYRAKPGVNVLPGNLMYRVLKEGTGDKPADLGAVVVKYRGTLVDGTEFDATPEGKTATFKLDNVITGLREALKRMPAGSAWELVVPTSLAYSTRGTELIGPNETLVFNLELVAVVN